MVKYQRIDMATELHRLAKGKRTRVPAREIADWAVEWVKAGLTQTQIEQLERMFQLRDPRP